MVYTRMSRFPDAESVFQEALAIRRDLAAQNPAAYLPYLANVLNNLDCSSAPFTTREASPSGATSQPKTPPPTAPIWRRPSTIWALSTATPIASTTLRASFRRPRHPARPRRPKPCPSAQI